jgi:hypothetical protein
MLYSTVYTPGGIIVNVCKGGNEEDGESKHRAPNQGSSVTQCGGVAELYAGYTLLAKRNA